MAKPRVYELAKVLNVDSKTVLEKLKDMGEFVKSASSTIEPPVARRLKAEFAKDNAKGDSKPVQQRCPAAPSAPASASSSAPTPAAPARQASPASAHQQAPTPGAPTPRPRGGARPGMPTPAATVRTTTVRMVAIIAKAVRTVVRVARTIAVTTIVVTTRPSEQWPAGSASEQPRQCFGSAPARSGRRWCQWRQCRFKCDSAPARSGPAPGQQPVLPQAGYAHPDAG